MSLTNSPSVGTTSDHKQPDYDYQYTETFSDLRGWEWIKARINSVLYFCAGADPQLLARCPHSERVKEQGVGGTVAATAALAFLSGSYAFYTVFMPKPGYANLDAQVLTFADKAPALFGAIFFGLVWSAIIFNLDRFIVSSTGHGDGTEEITWGEIGRAIPRLLMAIAIGFVLSKPIELKIMETEIEMALRVAQDAKKKELDKNSEEFSRQFQDGLEKQQELLRSEIRDREAKITKMDSELSDLTFKTQQELSGDGGTGRRGVGPIAQKNEELRQKQEDRVKSEKAVLQPEIDIRRKELADVRERIEKGIADKKAAFLKNAHDVAKEDGLIKRIDIAHDISAVASGTITMLLIFLEISPIFFKMMVAVGPYDYLIQNQRRLAIAQCGISFRKDVSPGGSGNFEFKDALFLEASAREAQESGKWTVEKELTQVAHNVFQERTAADIRANPDKYLQQEAKPKTS